MTKTEIRSIIRAHANSRDVRYRITKDDQVHYYGKMPNSIETGWYLVGLSSIDVAHDIQDGKL